MLDAGLADRQRVESAERTARRDGIPLVQALVEHASIPEDILADALARAIGSMVIDVDLGALDSDSVRLVPPEVARRHLMVPVAQAENLEVLRVAFANPLDREALSAAQEFSGLEVEPMVATLSAVRWVLDREYQKTTTDVIRSKVVGEVTRQIASPSESDKRLGTAPTHRLAEDATIEQRHEALLLTLVEAGILTRADYLAALKRLMGKR